MDRSDDIIDLLVVGGGTAGIVGAKTAARLGARTVLVERSRTGGDCLWTGCVPSKTLLSAAAARGNVPATDGDYFARATARIGAAIAAIQPDDSPAALEAAGVSVRHGDIRFTGPGEAELDGEKIRFHHSLVATGSAPLVPPIPGLRKATFVTSETVWDLTELPQDLVIIGGGPIACELGQAFARLGSRVVMLVRSGILPKEDPDAAAIIRHSLRGDGVTLLEDVEVQEVHTPEGACPASTVRTSDGGSFDADVILVATGRKPRTDDLGLEQVGVDLDERGHVVVDSAMRTSSPTIWAAGDVTPHPKFTHLAGMYASAAASNAVLGIRRSVDTTVPRVTYTSPEVAAVGMTTPDGPEFSVSTIRHEDSDRAVTEDRETGFSRLVIGKGGRIVGGTIVGPRAGESLGELTLAVQQKLTTRNLAGVIHPYPTYNDGLWNAAIADARSALDRRFVRLGLSVLVRVTRWRTARSRIGRTAA